MHCLDIKLLTSTALNCKNINALVLVKSSNIQKFEDLVKKDCGTDWLIEAVQSDRVKMIEFLLAAGVDLNIGNNPLVYSQSVAVAKLLCKYGADVNRAACTTDGDRKPLEYALVGQRFKVFDVMVLVLNL